MAASPTGGTLGSENAARLGRERAEEIAAARAKAKQKDIGAKDLDSFMVLLYNKFGTIHRAWHKHLDRDGNGRLSKMEFFQAARDLSYNGDLRNLWESLDDDGSGMISLNELAPDEKQLLDLFFTSVKQEYGSVYRGWKALDQDNSKRATREEFAAFCENVGADPAVFPLFDLDQTGFVKLENIDPAAAAAVARGEEELLLAQTDPASTKGKKGATAASQRQEILGRLERKRTEQERATLRKKDVGAKSKESFIQTLVGRFGTVVRAWRQVLDRHEIGRLSFVQFCNSVRNMGYTGNLKQLWAELDLDGGGFIELAEFDPKCADALKEFQRVMHQYDSVEAFWEKGLDPQRTRRLDKTAFKTIVRDVGYEGSVGKLWSALDLDGGGFITVDEIRFLWKWASHVRGDSWRAVVLERQRATARKRRHRAALRLPPMPHRPPPLSEEQLQLVEPLLRSTLSSLPDLEASMQRSQTMPSLGSTSAPNWGLLSTAESAGSKSSARGPRASPGFGHLLGRSFRIQ